MREHNGMPLWKPVVKLGIMTLILELEPETEETAREQAGEKGLPLAEYVGSVVKEAILRRKRGAVSEISFDEILAPVRSGFQESGMTEDELLDLFDEVREEVHQDAVVSK